MFVHDQFVFLQMRKTGSTFLVDALERELPSGGSKGLGKHWGWSKIPPCAVGLPVLTYVRNPWDWYVSWYHFNLMHGGVTDYWKVLSAEGTRSFGVTVRYALEASQSVMGGDLYSTLFRNITGDGLYSETLTIGRFESLVDDLETFLSATEVVFPAAGFARMRAAAPVNASDRCSYLEYYDDELYDLVGEWCGPLIDRFGYCS